MNRHRYRTISIFGWVIQWKLRYHAGEKVWFNWRGEKEFGCGYVRPFTVQSVEIIDHRSPAIPPGQYVHMTDASGKFAAFNECWLEY